MFEKYSYKVKFQALIVLFLMLSVAAYRRSFSTLINLVKENAQLSEKVENSSGAGTDIKKIQAELEAIDKVIGKTGADKEKIQQDIVSFATLHQGISINDMQAIHQFAGEGHIAYTNRLDVTGSFNELLNLAYEFEKNFTYSRLVNVNFYTVRKNNKPDVLHLKMIFQNYDKNN